MTYDQLRIFVAVAEREHVTRAAEALNLTQSAVSSAITTLEARYGVALFHRVGRRIELSEAGRSFMPEARAALAQAREAEQALLDIAGLRRGTLRLVASQTIASYWLPARLARFRATHPGIELVVGIDNSEGTARAVIDGTAELGFVEGCIDDPALAQTPVGSDRMVLIGTQRVAAVDAAWLARAPWIMREPGSGTRSTFEGAVAGLGLAAGSLDVVLTLPSNEAVLAAVASGAGHAVLSQLVVEAALAAGRVVALPLDLPARGFAMIRQHQRAPGKAARAFAALLDAAI